MTFTRASAAWIIGLGLLGGALAGVSCAGSGSGDDESGSTGSSKGSTASSAGGTSGATSSNTGASASNTGVSAGNTGVSASTGASAGNTGGSSTNTGVSGTSTGTTATGTTGATSASGTTTTTGTSTASSTGTTSASTSSSSATSGTTGGATTGTTGTLPSCTDTMPASVVKATSATITNFSPPDSAGMVVPGGVDAKGVIGNIWPYQAPVGNTYVYPAADRNDSPDCSLKAGATAPAFPLTSSLNPCDSVPTPGVFTISGTVGDYSGAGVSLWCPVDASMYRGVQFDIGGNFGPFATISFSVTSCTDATLTTCGSARKDVAVASDVSTASVLWTELVPDMTSTGTAGPALNSAVITGIAWNLSWYYPADAGAPYTATVTLDNLAWLP